MLSGIGPKDHLEDKGINVELDLPGVGSNLQHHVLGISHIKIANPDGTKIGASNFLLVDPLNYFKFFFQGRGPLTVAATATGAFLNTKSNKRSKVDPYGRPNIQILSTNFGLDVDYGLGVKSAFGVDDDVFKTMTGSNFGGYGTLWKELVNVGFKMIDIFQGPWNVTACFIKATKQRNLEIGY